MKAYNKLSKRRKAAFILLLIVDIFFLMVTIVGFVTGPLIFAIAAFFILNVPLTFLAIWAGGFKPRWRRMTEASQIHPKASGTGLPRAGIQSPAPKAPPPKERAVPQPIPEKLYGLDKGQSVAHSNISNLESRLRECIAVELQKVAPKTWWKERIPEDVRTNAEERKLRSLEQNPWKKENPSPIEYIDFVDYSKTILRKDNWRQAFEAIFKNEDIVRFRLAELSPLRNDIMHGRRLSSEQIQKVSIFTKELIELIPNYQTARESISKSLMNLGDFVKHRTQSDFTYDNFSYDVVWKKLEHGVPSKVFVIQENGNTIESLTKLKHANDLWNSSVYLILSEHKLAEAQSLLQGSFHELVGKITLICLDDAKDQSLLQEKIKKSDSDG